MNNLELELKSKENINLLEVRTNYGLSEIVTTINKLAEENAEEIINNEIFYNNYTELVSHVLLVLFNKYNTFEKIKSKPHIDTNVYQILTMKG